MLCPKYYNYLCYVFHFAVITNSTFLCIQFPYVFFKAFASRPSYFMLPSADHFCAS